MIVPTSVKGAQNTEATACCNTAQKRAVRGLEVRAG
jgi:hypothetical protein